MKAADYRGWLERRELTHEAAGRALGVHKSTSKRYGAGVFGDLTAEGAFSAVFRLARSASIKLTTLSGAAFFAAAIGRLLCFLASAAS